MVILSKLVLKIGGHFIFVFLLSGVLYGQDYRAIFENPKSLDSLYQAINDMNQYFCHNRDGRLNYFRNSHYFVDFDEGYMSSISSFSGNWKLDFEDHSFTIKEDYDEKVHSFVRNGYDISVYTKTDTLSLLDVVISYYDDQSQAKKQILKGRMLIPLQLGIKGVDSKVIVDFEKRIIYGTEFKFEKNEEIKILYCIVEECNSFDEILHSVESIIENQMFFNQYRKQNSPASTFIYDNSSVGFIFSNYTKKKKDRSWTVSYYPENLFLKNGIKEMPTFTLYEYRKNGRLKRNKIDVKYCD